VAELIIISTLNGVLYGLLLFLMASGLTLIFSMMGVLNFAHASFYMLGAFLGYQISQWAGFVPALILAPLIAGGLGALIERFGLRTVHKHGHVAELLFTFGLAFIIEENVQMIWGKLAMDYRIPSWLDFPAFTVYATNYPVLDPDLHRIDPAAHPHARRPHHSGVAHPPEHGRHARP